MEKLRAGKTRQQIEQIKELLETKESIFVYGLMSPERYLDQLNASEEEEYTAKEIYREEFNIETEQIEKTLIGCTIKKN